MFIRKSEVAARVIVPVTFAILGLVAPREFSEPVKPSSTSKIEKKLKKVARYAAASPARARQEPQAGPQQLDMAALTPKPLSPPVEVPVTRTEGSVFASVAFPIGGIPGKARWATVSAAELDTSCGEDCSAGAPIASAIESAKAKPVQEKLAAINAAVNRAITYTRDQDVYGTRDYWAKPQETLTRAKGDCEDYAILKMAALKAAGVPAENMTLVVLRDQRRNLFHAVLSVTTERGQYVLDNLRNDVPRDTALGDYQALYSMSEDRAFIHGYPTGSKLAARSTPAIGTAQPGEGIERKS